MSREESLEECFFFFSLLFILAVSVSCTARKQPPFAPCFLNTFGEVTDSPRYLISIFPTEYFAQILFRDDMEEGNPFFKVSLKSSLGSKNGERMWFKILVL